MFSKIRNRLSLLYAAMMAFFLVTFVTVCFLGVTYVTTNELDQSIRMLAREEAEEQLEFYNYRGDLEGFEQEIRAEDENDFGGQMFYYVFNMQGKLMNSEEPSPAIRQLVLERINEWHAAEGEIQRFTFVLPNGHHRMVIMTTRSIADGQKTLGIIFMGKDISDQYHMLRRMFLILAGLVIVFLAFAAAAAYFMAGRAMIPIKQSFTRQKEFVADASHELRTPLSVLMASVDAIGGDEENRITPFSLQVFVDMKDELRKMSKIVADLLTLARADVGAVQLLKESFDFRLEAERIIRNLQPLAREKEISLTLQSPDLPKIYADRERLDQLLMILLDNAIKYTPEGGAVVLHMEIDSHQRDKKLIFSVVDNGIGIAAEHLSRIFERFYRVDKTRSREVGGTGLGLSIAAWIVKEHRGIINVSSNPGKGTTFTVTLPV